MNTRPVITSKFGVQKLGKESNTTVLPQQKDSTVNLRDRLNDILKDEKQLMSVYSSGSIELVDQQLIDIVNQNMKNCSQLQKNMFEQLFDLGEYQIDLATGPQIKDAFDMFNNYKVQLPYPQGNQNMMN